MKHSFVSHFIYMVTFLALLMLAGAVHAETPPEPGKYTWRGSWTLYPKDADLRFARRMSIQKNTQPHYLHEWENGSAVMFPVHISEAGTYNISISYSRYSVMQKVFIVGVFALKEPMMHGMLDASAHFYAELSVTKGWSDFQQKTIGTLTLPQGTAYLLFTNKDTFPHEYVMNVQQVQLKKQ